MIELKVELGERSYPILIGPGLLGQSHILAPRVRGSQAMVVSNEVVAPLYLRQVAAALGNRQVDHCILPDGEEYKTLEVLQRIFDALLQHRHNRTTTLVALGGGVVGDMAGFAAACYQRGVDFIQVPTTLLAQVDSSVGGKTGVNHPLGKNMIGAFHQPRMVLIDTDCLGSLPMRELSAGLAEVIKYGLIGDPDFFVWLEESVRDLLALDADKIGYAIRRSCENKAAVVAADEREGGSRALLNLGHTFGHAIETEMGYGHWLHGEAVAIGMVMAAQLSRLLGHLSDGDVERIVALLRRAGLPVQLGAGVEAGGLLQHMAVDKKVTDGRLRLVLMERIGTAVIRDDVPADMIVEAIKLCR